MSHNDTEIIGALNFRLATPDVRGFKEHCQRLGLESAERCVRLAMDDVILLFQRKEQAYYERKLIELRDGAENNAIAFAEFCANYGGKGPVGAWSEHMWRGNVMAGEPALSAEQLYSEYLKTKEVFISENPKK